MAGNTDENILDDAEAHTRAKHQILQEYLKGWLPILGQGQDNRLLYFDGFAGCGELTGGHLGSPLVAIRTALQGSAALKVPLYVEMIEKNQDRCSHLQTVLNRETASLASISNRIIVEPPVCDSCENAVQRLLDETLRTKSRLGPAFFFLDQYGYSGFSMDLVRRILANDKCEVFAYLNWQRMHPYLTDPTKEETFTRALGGDEWRQVQPLRDQERVDRFKSIYIDALQTRAKAKYVYDFAMRGPDHRLIYWLFFATNSLKGLEVMKKAMWKVDPSGAFEFSDKFASQGALIGYTPNALANDLDRALRNQKLSSAELKEFVLTKTPEYRFDDAIKILKDRGQVKVFREQGKVIYAFSAPPMQTASMFD